LHSLVGHATNALPELWVDRYWFCDTSDALIREFVFGGHQAKNQCLLRITFSSMNGLKCKRSEQSHQQAKPLQHRFFDIDVEEGGFGDLRPKRSLMRKRRAAPKFSHPPRGAWRTATGLGALYVSTTAACANARAGLMGRYQVPKSAQVTIFRFASLLNLHKTVPTERVDDFGSVLCKGTSSGDFPHGPLLTSPVQNG
jgi:hypothetical protein